MEDTRVGFLVDGTPTDQQRAAHEWAASRFSVAEVGFDDLSGSLPYDVVWWHCDEPAPAIPDDAASALREYVHGGGGLLLGLRAMATVDALGVDPVAPDVVGTAGISAPTGLLWRSLYDDHPAVADFERLRIPVCDRGTAPFARYETILPERGEVLAATVEGGRDMPRQMSVVSWQPGDGAVLGVAAPLTFATDVAPEVRADRDRVAAGFVEALAGEPDPLYSRPTDRDALERRRRLLADDPDRPRYHLTAPANWLNDPNGLIERDGRYHVFYQYNPAGPFHHTIHWGHAVSDDLVTWRDEPVALSPSPDGPDRDGCWSGCAVDDGGTTTVLYTGGRGREQLPCLATADDPSLRSWTKHNANPIIEEVPTDLDLLETEHWETEFRDHCVWRADGQWHQIIGSGVTDVGGAALLYTSEDLRNWEYEGPLLVGDWEESGTVWECPELLDFGDRQLLHVSNYEDVVYFLGELDGGDFAVERRGVLDHGDFYAPQSLRDGDGYLTWGWLPEARDLEAQWNAGWSGVLSLPRRLDLDDAGRLRQRPADAVTDLRKTRQVASASRTLADGDRWRPAVSGRSLEVRATISLDDADAVTLSALESPDGRERTDLRYTGDELLVDRSHASREARATTDPQSTSVPPYDEPLSLRLFVDGSVVEAFANERECLTSRVYPTRSDSTGLSLTVEGGRATVTDLSVWELGSAWPAVEREAKRSVPPTE